MRSFVMSTFALALALAPAAAFAQQTPPTTPPTTGQPPAGQAPAAQAAPAAIKLGFTSPAGMLLVQVKSDQTATFEEMMGKIINGVGGSTDDKVKAEAGTWKYYKAAEPAPGGNVMYVVIVDPAHPDTEYQFLEVLNRTLTDEQKRDPATQDMYKKYAAAIASMNKLNLTAVGK